MANPSIAPYAHTSDGIIRNTGTTWSTVNSAGTGTLTSTAGTFNGLALAGFSTPNYTLDRGFLSFDLSSIPAGSEILTATLSVYYNGTKGGTGEIGIVSGSPASATSYATSDFGSVGSTELATRKNLTAFSSAAYYDYTLNSSGLAYLQGRIGSYATLVGRTSYDLDTSSPGSGNHYAYIYYADQTGTANDPYLTVTYSTARTTSDAWAWSDSAHTDSLLTSSGTEYRRETADSWAWSDSAAPYRRAVAEVTVRDQDANTALNGAHNPVGATITVDDTTGFPSSGTIWVIDNTTSLQHQAYATYTGKTGTTFTGCSWTSVIGETTYGDGSLNFADNSGVSLPTSENYFPQVTALDDPATTSEPELLVSWTQKAGHGALSGKLAFKTSTNGGLSWGTEQYVVSSPANGAGWGIYGHTMCRLKNGRLVAMWNEHQANYSVAGSILVNHMMLSYSDDRGASWSTPAVVPVNFGYSDYDGSVGFGSTLYTGAGSDATYGDLYVGLFGNKDGIQVHSSGQTYRWETWLYKVTDGGTAGTVTKVAEVFKYSDIGLAAGEPDLVIAENGDWIMHARVEADTTAYDAEDRDRWQSVSTDQGATWSTPTMVIHGFANGAVLEKLPGGTLISTGSPVLAADTSYGQTGTVPSHDNGTTWTRSIKWEATDGTYTVYNGADTEVIIDDASVQVNTAFTYAQERTSQTGARVRFRWYVDPVKRASDQWDWSDAATGLITASFKTTADTWAWSDTATRTTTVAKAAADFWAWSDFAAQTFSSDLSRATSDTWGWTDSTTRDLAASRTTSDTWAWSDTAEDTYAGPHYYSRTTSDTWAWSDRTTAPGTALYWLRAARRRDMSAPVKTYVQVLPKGTTRTTSYTSPTYEAKTEAGILVVLDVTDASGAGGLTVRINAHDQASSQAVALNAAPTAVTATGTTSYALYPFGAVAGNVTQATSFYLPRLFSISVTAGDSSSYTYSLGYCLLP